jgi:hypothetical protein
LADEAEAGAAWSGGHARKRRRVWAKYQEAMSVGLGAEVAHRACILDWYNKISTYAEHARLLGNMRKVAQPRVVVPMRTRTWLRALEKLKPYVPTHRVVREWSYERVTEVAMELPPLSRVAHLILWALGARATSVVEVRAGDARLVTWQGKEVLAARTRCCRTIGPLGVR